MPKSSHSVVLCVLPLLRVVLLPLRCPLLQYYCPAAVTSYGFASLESRLNQKAMKQEKTERSTKIISKLGGALSAAKSWFW